MKTASPSHNRADRIAIVLPKLQSGGIETVRLKLAQEFIERGHNVDIVVGRRTGELAKAVPSEARLFEVAPHSPLLLPYGLWRYLSQQRPTAILSAFDDVNCFALLSNLARRHPANIVISQHNSFDLQARQSAGMERVRFRLLRVAMRRLYPQADAIIAVSRGAASELAQLLNVPESRIDVIYNPIITSNFNTLRDKPNPTWNVFSRERPYLTFVGRLHKQKRVDILLRAYAMLPPSTRPRLAIVGDGPERETLQHQAADLSLGNDVHFFRYVQNPLPIIRDALALVLSSDHEGLPGVLIEALACGTQVVSTDCPHGPAEILEQGRLGELVPPRDTGALAAAMRRSLDGDSTVAPELLCRAVERFSLPEATKRYLALMGFASAPYTRRSTQD